VLQEELLQAEIDKFVLIRDTISQLLATSEGRTEKEWQQMILKFILLIFPKYVAVLENVQIEDHYSKLGATTRRFIDIALVDANGSLDVIEIKRPFDDVLLFENAIPRQLRADQGFIGHDYAGREVPVPPIEVGHSGRDETHQQLPRAIAARDVDPDYQP